jgi:hypothetical protein
LGIVSIVYESQCLDVDDGRRYIRTKLRTSEADHLHLDSRSHHVMPGSPECNSDHVLSGIIMMQEVHVIIRNANYSLPRKSDTSPSPNQGSATYKDYKSMVHLPM